MSALTISVTNNDVSITTVNKPVTIQTESTAFNVGLAEYGGYGPKGDKGDQGPIGPPGSSHGGLTAGGQSGDLLMKSSNIDYEVEWVAQANLVINAGYF